jgi:hypothetical protein
VLRRRFPWLTNEDLAGRAVTYGSKRRGQPRRRHERQLAICRQCATAAAERAGTEPPTFVAMIESEAA